MKTKTTWFKYIGLAISLLALPVLSFAQESVAVNGVHYILKSPRLPKGKTDLKFNFIRTRPFGGEGELHVNGKKVDEVEMPQMHIATYSLAETFDVGRDTGTQVSDLYNGIFKFNGSLDGVIFTVSDESTVPPRKLPAMYY